MKYIFFKYQVKFRLNFWILHPSSVYCFLFKKSYLFVSDINSETGSIISEDQLDTLSGDFSLGDEFDLSTSNLSQRSHSNPESPDCSMPSAITPHRMVRKSSEHSMGEHLFGDKLDTPLSQRLKDSLLVKAAVANCTHNNGGLGQNGDSREQTGHMLKLSADTNTADSASMSSSASRGGDKNSGNLDEVKIAVPTQAVNKPVNQRVLEVKTAPPSTPSPQGSPKHSPKHNMSSPSSGTGDQRVSDRRSSPRSPRRSTSSMQNGEIMLDPSSLQSHQNYFPASAYRPFGPRMSPMRSQLKPAESDPLNALGSRLK